MIRPCSASRTGSQASPSRWSITCYLSLDLLSIQSQVKLFFYRGIFHHNHEKESLALFHDSKLKSQVIIIIRNTTGAASRSFTGVTIEST
jgi:hypothetical protein